MARSGVKYKADYLWESPDDDKRYEVIFGELHVMPPPSVWHQLYLSRLHFAIGQVVYKDSLGELLEAPTGVALDEAIGVEPDLLFVRKDRFGIFSQRGVEGPPDLVVEVLSPSTRRYDRGVKMRGYAAGRVPNYWIMDPDAPSLETYRLGEQGYELTGRYGPGDIFRPELFPGLEIDLDRIWSQQPSRGA